MKKKILIVDDESYLIDIQETIVKREGHDCVKAENGRQAVDVAAAELPDLILLDFSLPDMNALEVARLLRQNPQTQSTPIIIVTGDTSLKQKDECLDAGLNEYITKPFKPKQVVSSIRKLLK
ncbi:MAG: response regulator [Candidatus Binatia bacterium]